MTCNSCAERMHHNEERTHTRAHACTHAYMHESRGRVTPAPRLWPAQCWRGPVWKQEGWGGQPGAPRSAADEATVNCLTRHIWKPLLSPQKTEPPPAGRLMHWTPFIRRDVLLSGVHSLPKSNLRQPVGCPLTLHSTTCLSSEAVTTLFHA